MPRLSTNAHYRSLMVIAKEYFPTVTAIYYDSVGKCIVISYRASNMENFFTISHSNKMIAPEDFEMLLSMEML